MTLTLQPLQPIKNLYNDVVCIFQSGFCRTVRCILTIVHLWPKRVWLDRGFNYTPQSAPNGSVTQGVSASKATTKGPPLPRQTLRSSRVWPSVRTGSGPPLLLGSLGVVCDCWYYIKLSTNVAYVASMQIAKNIANQEGSSLW